MKTPLLFLFLVITTATIGQTIRIADNNATHPTGANIYPTLQAAINAAVSGDLVYVQPSTVTYGDVTIDHPITLRGIGFNTGKDYAYPSIVNNVILTNNVANSSNANGTIIEGISGNTIVLGNQTGLGSFTLQNITISNCSLGSVSRGSMPASNIVIKNCTTSIDFNTLGTVSQLFIYQNVLTTFQFGGSGTISSSILSNNIVRSSNANYFGNNGTIITISNLIITNNNFLGENNVGNSHFMWLNLHDALITNNIFYGCAPNSSSGNLSFEHNSFSNNISFGTTADALPPAGTGVGNTGAGNLVAQDPKFVNAAFNTVYAVSMNFNLQSGSPALLAGSDGTDIGITGGAYPVLAGNNTLKPTTAPVIITLNPAAMVPQNQPVITNIKAKSN